MSLCLLVVNLGWKHVFDFLQKLAYFTAKNAANKLKRDVFSQIAIESVQKHWNPAKTRSSQWNLGNKILRTGKKNFWADLPIFRQDNCQTATN